LDVYEPQANFLALMMTGDGQAIGSYRGIAYTGSLAWKLKNKIDRCVSEPPAHALRSQRLAD
jgi:hypothetical protein